MALESHIGDITRTIQLAVAPVFLLTAISTLIMALNNRLGRVVDRRRSLTEKLRNPPPDTADELREELALISRRLRYIYLAILFAVTGALAICLVVASAFIGALLGVDLARAVAVFFIAAMVALIVCLTMFLREVFLAVTGGRRVLPGVRNVLP
jgi:hypothetical protein